MKLLILTDGYPPYHAGGAGVIAARLAREYVRQGHQVTVLTTVRRQKDAGIQIEPSGITVVRIRVDYNLRWRAYASLFNPIGVAAVRQLLTQYQPDAIHAHNVHIYLSYASLLAARRAGVPVVLMYHDAMAFDYGKCTQVIDYRDLSPSPILKKLRVSAWQNVCRYRAQFFPLRNFFIRWVVRQLVHTCAVSHALCSLLQANGVRCDRVIHNGIDPSLFSLQPVHPRLRMLRAEGRPIILFVGRLSYLKGSNQLLHALPIVRRRTPTATLVCVCKEDAGWQVYHRQAVELGMGEYVITTGWVSQQEMPSVYAGADAVVVPSIYLDPFPTVVLEAMACRKPVVATCFGGAKEVVIHGETGLIVNPLNVEHLAEAIVQILADPRQAKRMGDAGHQRVLDCFTIKQQAEKYLGMLLQSATSMSEGLKTPNRVAG